MAPSEKPVIPRKGILFMSTIECYSEVIMRLSHLEACFKKDNNGYQPIKIDIYNRPL